MSKKLNKLALMMAGVLAATSVAAYAAADSADLVDSEEGVFLGTVYLNARTYRIDASTEAEFAGNVGENNYICIELYDETNDFITKDSSTKASVIEAYISEKDSYSGEYKAYGQITRGSLSDYARVYAEAT